MLSWNRITLYGTKKKKNRGKRRCGCVCGYKQVYVQNRKKKKIDTAEPFKDLERLGVEEVDFSFI